MPPRRYRAGPHPSTLFISRSRQRCHFSKVHECAVARPASLNSMAMSDSVQSSCQGMSEHDSVGPANRTVRRAVIGSPKSFLLAGVPASSETCLSGGVTTSGAPVVPDGGAALPSPELTAVGLSFNVDLSSKREQPPGAPLIPGCRSSPQIRGLE